ncbi:MAG: glycine--tRNA ligase subunit beta [Actinobacteria bacterium]|nr:glycine--tRNA ligase subunit beta [Actinomycetota bacterium]
MSLLLIEIGTEELPYRVCESVVRQLEGTTGQPGLALSLLTEERLLEEGAAAEFLVSPRRIAVLVDGVPHEQLAQVQEFRGPKAEIAFAEDGSLTKAGAGFARSKGAAAADVRREVIDGTEFAVVSVEADRRAARDVVPELVARLITGLQIPRGMRWGARPAGASDYLRFSRPIRWLVVKLDDETLSGEFYGLRLGDVSQGHRVLGAPVTVTDAGAYERLLEEQKVVVSQHERMRLIRKGLDTAAGQLGGSWSDPGDVLAEAVYLAEWPSVARGSFDERHLRLPDEVLVTAMQSHQRYFPVRDADGGLLPAFLYVSNGDPAAAPLVTRGNERVLDGRLDDAEFAYDRDLAEGLPAMAERLGAVVFHEKLGSLADKARRLGGLVAALEGGRHEGPGGNGSGDSIAETLRTAARLAKADLVSQTVIEFPVLQGIMGGLFAEAAGLGDAVARAVGEHYRPLSATAPLPTTVPGSLLAVADKLDNIVGAWVAGEKPSGSRDPYGLRRAAMGIVRIALEFNLRFPLAGLLTAAVDQFELQGIDVDGECREGIVDETAAFVRERLQVLLLDEGLPFPSVEAALGAPAADLPSLAVRARGFAAMAGRESFQDAVIAYNRCAALAAKDPAAGERSVDPALFSDDAERELAAAYEAARGPLLGALDNLELESAIDVAAGLRPAVDRYFDAVLVMDPDDAVRANRLAQLAAVTGLIGRIGAFGRLPLGQT